MTRNSSTRGQVEFCRAPLSRTEDGVRPYVAHARGKPRPGLEGFRT